MSEWILLGIGFLLTIGTGLFVASEFALVNLDRADLEARRERLGEERRDRRLHRVPGEQRREGDAELRAGEVRRGDLERRDRHAEPGLAPGAARFEISAIEVDERELAGNEQARADREEESDAEEYPLRQRSLPDLSRARVYGRAFSQRGDRPLSPQYIRAGRAGRGGPAAGARARRVTRSPRPSCDAITRVATSCSGAPCPPRTPPPTGRRRARGRGTPRSSARPHR